MTHRCGETRPRTSLPTRHPTLASEAVVDPFFLSVGLGLHLPPAPSLTELEIADGMHAPGHGRAVRVCPLPIVSQILLPDLWRHLHLQREAEQHRVGLFDALQSHTHNIDRDARGVTTYPSAITSPTCPDDKWPSPARCSRGTPGVCLRPHPSGARPLAVRPATWGPGPRPAAQPPRGPPPGQSSPPHW